MFSIRKGRYTYRVVSPVKFVISSLIIATLVIAIIYGCYASYNTVHIYLHRNDVPAPIPVYSYSYNGIDIYTTDREEYVTSLENELTAQSTKSTDIESKYLKTIASAHDVTEADGELYREFRYVLQAPMSDFTMDDIKMTVDLCKKYTLNPHLWYAAVDLESKFYSNPKMSRGSSAKGWGQVLDTTGKYIYEQKLKLGPYDHNKMGADKEINAKISIYYLSSLIQENGGSIEKGLLRYNAEIGQRYVDIVADNLRRHTGLTLNDVAQKQ